jgi:hypothetical protein
MLHDKYFYLNNDNCCHNTLHNKHHRKIKVSFCLMNMLPLSYSEKSIQPRNMHDAPTELACPEALTLISDNPNDLCDPS